MIPSPETPARVLLLSAYDAVSHRRWRESLVAMLPEFDWQVLSLPPRHFAWRVRGNALSWTYADHAAVLGQRFDALVATSMCDLIGLRGLWPGLAPCPALVYVHENQFAYPDGQQAARHVEPAMMSLSTMLSADQVLFNSDYNRASCLSGAEALLRRMPDHRPLAALEQLRQRSQVLPVPVPDDCFVAPQPQPGPLRVVWNHRWEYDKAPDRLLLALRILRQRREPLALVLLGQRFRQVPDAIALIQSEFADWLVQAQPEPDEALYRQQLAQSDVVVSTALHDFQGLAVLEGMAAGCRACVPDRLAYPEFVPEDQRYPSRVDSPADDAVALADHLQALAAAKRQGSLPEATPPERLRESWARAAWQKHLRQLLVTGRLAPG